MQRYDFKRWFLALDTSVESIPMPATVFVEHIIRMDPLITYERLRDVSLAGYRLLIKVAAALQVLNV
jgi:hypothetical protein